MRFERNKQLVYNYDYYYYSIGFIGANPMTRREIPSHSHKHKTFKKEFIKRTRARTQTNTHRKSRVHRVRRYKISFL